VTTTSGGGTTTTTSGGGTTTTTSGGGTTTTAPPGSCVSPGGSCGIFGIQTATCCAGSTCEGILLMSCVDSPTPTPTVAPTPTPTVAPIVTTVDITVNFGINNASPWIQSSGGDMRVDSGFNSPIPANPTCGANSGAYASLLGSGGTPGIIFSGDSTPGFGQGTPSINDWLVGGTVFPDLFNPVVSKKTSTSMILSKAAQMGIPITDIKTACGGDYANCDLPNNLASGAYRADGDLTLSGAGINFSAGQNYVIIVKGNLNVNEKIIVPNGSTAIFSAYNINIAGSVGEADSTSTASDIEGWFSADGNFTVNGTNNCSVAPDLKLNIAGSVVVGAGGGGGGFENNRDLCAANVSCPVIYIKERPDFILNAPAIIKTSSYTWQEVAP